MVDVEHDAGLPAALVERVPADEWLVVRAWWSGLAQDDRTDLRTQWSIEDLDFEEPHDAALTVLLAARFVDTSAQEARITREQEQEDLDAHNEWRSERGGSARTFRLGCQAHPTARQALRAGLIPADFRCPFAHERCPMRELLSRRPGHAAVLTVASVIRRGRTRRRITMALPAMPLASPAAFAPRPTGQTSTARSRAARFVPPHPHRPVIVMFQLGIHPIHLART